MPALVALFGWGVAKDMYNCDLYPCAHPDRSYNCTLRKGHKKNTTHGVTIMLCASADGFE